MAVSAWLQIRNKAHGSINAIADTEQGTWQYQRHCRHGTRHMAVSAPLQIRNKAHGSISAIADTEQGTWQYQRHCRHGTRHMAVSAPLQTRNKAHGSISAIADTEQGMLTLYPRQHFRRGVAHLLVPNLVVSPSKALCPRRHSDL